MLGHFVCGKVLVARWKRPYPIDYKNNIAIIGNIEKQPEL